MSFAKSLRTARLRAGLTQRELAAKAGCVRESVQCWEYGQRVPAGDSMRKLARALGLKLSEMPPAEPPRMPGWLWPWSEDIRRYGPEEREAVKAVLLKIRKAAMRGDGRKPAGRKG
jgi:transcriptional regulator with XRE-family HTH domain